MDEVERVTAPAVATTYIQWGPALAGAVGAAALSTVLHSFAGAIGLAVGSTAPTWRDASVALWVLSGLYLVLVALAAYGMGGYLTGRLRSRLNIASSDEVEFRDGAHGLLVWAVATLLTVLILAWGASAATRLAAPSGGMSGPGTSVAGENVIAFDLDRLFRADRELPETDLSYHRAEAARILLTASGHSGVAAGDRTYLVRLVSALTGAAQPAAEQRVDAAIASARDNIAKARRSAVIMAFMAGAAALLGAAAAWFAAVTGGRHRDEAAPRLRWTALGPRLIVKV
jgi:hypothetical protein